MRVNFEEISIKAVKKWKDEKGRRQQKTKCFSQTLNPFNKDKNGCTKSRALIMMEIRKERNLWLNGKD